jgi:hypothetical protein
MRFQERLSQSLFNLQNPGMFHAPTDYLFFLIEILYEKRPSYQLANQRSRMMNNQLPVENSFRNPPGPNRGDNRSGSVPRQNQSWIISEDPITSGSTTQLVRGGSGLERNESIDGYPPMHAVNLQNLETNRYLGTTIGGNGIARMATAGLATPVPTIAVDAIPFNHEGPESRDRMNIPDIPSTTNEDQGDSHRHFANLFSSYQRRLVLERLDEAIAIASGDPMPAATAVSASSPHRTGIPANEPDTDQEQ